MASAQTSHLRLQDLCTKEWFWRVPHLLKLNILLMVPFLSSYVGGFDGSMLNGIQTVEKWQQDFNHPSGSILGLLVNMQVIGGVISLPLAPWAADKFGRRHPICFGSIIIIIASLIQAFAQNMAMFLAGRCLIGLGGGFIATASPPLLGELAYPTHRPIFTAVYNTTWYLGAIVAAWSTYGTFRLTSSWSWRIPSLLQALVSTIQIITIYFVPESPRWLIANDRTEDAAKVLTKYHSGTEEPTDLVRFEIAEITAAIEFERSLQSVSYFQFFRTRGNRHRLFIVVLLGFLIQWCGNQLISSYLALVLRDTGITDPETQNLINGYLQIYNWIIAISGGLMVDRAGRRPLFLTSAVGMLVAFSIWTGLSARRQQIDGGDKGLGIGVVAMVFVFYTFYNIAMQPLPIAYVLEVLPYSLRTKGLTAFNLAQFCSGIFNGFVSPVAIERLRWKYYVVFVCALVLWIVLIYFTFPETKGLTLEEVSQIFDGQGALERTYDIKDKVDTKVDHTEKVTTDRDEV